MPVISKIGRSSPGVRVLFTVLYTLLACGAVTMIVPFLMMLSGSISSQADISDYRIVPKFLNDDSALFARYLNDKYQGDLFTLKELYRYELSRIDVRTGTVKEMVEKLKLRETLDDPAQRKLVAEYDEFLARAIPTRLWNCGFNLGGLIGPVNKHYQAWLKQRFGSLDALNTKYSDQYKYWAELGVPAEVISLRNWAPVYHERYRDFIEFKSTLPAWARVPFEGTKKWQEHLRYSVDGKIEQLNQTLGTRYADFVEIPLPRTAPGDAATLKLWDDFVRRKWPLRMMQLNDDGLREYRLFVEARRKTIAHVNEEYGSQYKTFDEIQWPEGEQFEGTRQSDLLDLLKGGNPGLPGLTIGNVTLINASGLFGQWLLDRHGGTVEGVNHALGTKFAGVADITIPHALWDWHTVVSRAGHWRWEFVKANYFEVVAFILTKGRALVNTVVFVLLSIVVTLTVNPLCAYALSRFNLSYAYKVLLFLLATMAFPGEVTLIPNFLLLRDLGLLNTFAALILPGMASGFSIFILKGFFDTLPKELYEAAQLDGAGELRMFWQITVPLCQPVFAYTALITFTGAYGAFLFALTVCQDPNMWTIMVWLYDMQRSTPEHIKVAALVIAMIPTLVVFVTCQRVIMRGIVLPQMN